MLRRLLACLALFTGLAALGAPASPAMADVVAGQIGASVMAEQSEGGQACACASETAPCTERPSRKPLGSVRRTIRVYIPTVQFGADRAYE